MKKIWQTLGIVAYWLTVPGIRLLLHRTVRTRLLIQYKDQVVVVKPWLGNGKWCLPGGGLHTGESPASGVLRETKEEVGIALLPKDCEDYGSQAYGHSGLSFTYHLFGATVSSKLPIKKQLIEIVEASWINVADLVANNANQDVLLALEKSRKRS